MVKQSAGILAYRRQSHEIEVFLIHPGGPFWANKDEGAWSIPKGEFDDSEEPLAAAKREFQEEIGQPIAGKFLALTPVRQPSRKVVHAFAVEAQIDPANLKSNSFELEWPPRSGKRAMFPEVDRAAWFSISEASKKMLPGQLPILIEVQKLLKDELNRT